LLVALLALAHSSLCFAQPAKISVDGATQPADANPNADANAYVNANANANANANVNANGVTTSSALSSEAPSLAINRTQLWPYTLDLHALIGVEPHSQGNAVAFGAGAEFYWHGRVGAFAELLASNGLPIIPPMQSGHSQPSLPDRVSIPFGFAARPFAVGQDQESWGRRLLAGIGVQLGLAVEYLRTSDDSVTTAGLHLGVGIDVPLYRGPLQGNAVALRLYGRALFTPSVTLEANKTVEEPVASAQLYAGIVYYP
jgi:hypothetical protein